MRRRHKKSQPKPLIRFTNKKTGVSATGAFLGESVSGKSIHIQLEDGSMVTVRRSTNIIEVLESM